MENYQHRRLDTSTSEIRLVRIEKKTNSDATKPVRLTLRHAFLDGDEKFTSFNALSYVWGDDSASNEVEVYDGQSTGKLLVRNNLHDFLRVAERCTDEWSSQWIFIDQVCIDQNHLKERCHQVGQMGKLYSTALATIVWSQSKPNPPRDPEISSWEAPMYEGKEMKNACKRAQISKNNAAKAKAIMAYLRLQTVGSTYDFLLRSYWWRAWILQEIILARRVCILMPDRLWTIEDLILATNIVAHSHPTLFSVGLHVKILLLHEAEKLQSRLDRICCLRQDRLKTPNSGKDSDPQEKMLRTSFSNHWHDILLLAKDALSTYPSDLLYGMMGLVREDVRFEVDYELTPVDLLIRILHSHRKIRSLAIFTNQIIRAWYDIFEAVLGRSGVDLNHVRGDAFRNNLWRAVRHYDVAKSRAISEKQLDQLIAS